VKEAKITAELLSCTPHPLLAIEAAGRTCYKSEDRIEDCATCGGTGFVSGENLSGDGVGAYDECPECAERARTFAAMLIKRGHEAMIEHAVATFRFVCDRGVTHELVRHRLASFGQESTRYCNYGKDKFGSEITVIRPPGLTDEQWERREDLFAQIEMLYLMETGERVKPQIARGILPISLKTEIVTTANFREWRHILKLRTAKPAHPQIRIMMRQVYDVFAKKWPVIVEDVEPYEE